MTGIPNSSAMKVSNLDPLDRSHCGSTATQSASHTIGIVALIYSSQLSRLLSSQGLNTLNPRFLSAAQWCENCRINLAISSSVACPPKLMGPAKYTVVTM